MKPDGPVRHLWFYDVKRTAEVRTRQPLVPACLFCSLEIKQANDFFFL
jgi:hypothetical protein